MPQVQGILETAIYVSDLERSVDWFGRVMGLSEILHDKRMCAFNVGQRNVLLLFQIGGSIHGEEMPGGFIPPHDAAGRIHFAFAIDATELDAWKTHLQQNGVEIESEVKAERGGTSLYFRDPDGHLVELATRGLWPHY
ncbi:MAG TPA: VOC family protein [Abditibacteriaceae bacterium]|jgi:catechol 2,3-dioxygenase-like lactoylglutathione lyase family enzyme